MTELNLRVCGRHNVSQDVSRTASDSSFLGLCLAGGGTCGGLCQLVAHTSRRRKRALAGGSHIGDASYLGGVRWCYASGR